MSTPALPGRRRTPRSAAAFAVVALLLAAGLLLWSKWAPYSARVEELAGTRAWSGSSVLDGAGIAPGSGPSLVAGWEFTTVYALAVWKALVAGLVIAAAVQTLVPRRWLTSALRRRSGPSSALVGGLLSTPSMGAPPGAPAPGECARAARRRSPRRCAAAGPRRPGSWRTGWATRC